MNNKRWDNFTKIRYSYSAALVVVLLIVSIVLFRMCFKMLADSKAEMNRTFENYYRIVESKIDGFEKVSDALFDNGDVKSFSEDLKGYYNAYKAVPVGKEIGLFESIFNEGQYSIVLTNLENDICVCSGGSTNLSDVRRELQLDDTSINKIKSSNSNDNLYLYSEEKGMISFVFQHRYRKNADSLYCFVTADVNALLPNENFVIATESDLLPDTVSSVKPVQIRNTYLKESLYVPGLVYKYHVKYNNTLLLAFLIFCILLCVICMFYIKKISEKILNITYMPIIKAARLVDSKEPAQGIEEWNESVRKLIYNIEMLQSKLKENKGFRKKTYLRNLLYDIEDCQEKYLKEYDLKYLNAECRVILIGFANRNEYAIMKELRSSSEFESNLERQISQNMSGEFVAINDERYAYITNFCDKGDLQKNLVKVLDFAELCGMEAFISVGDKVEGLKNIKISFRNALDCIERKDVFSQYSIVFSSELTSEVASFYYPIDLEIMLIDNTLIGNQAIVEGILNKLFDKNLHEISLDDDKIRELKIVIVGTINRIINRMNKAIKDIFGETSSIYLEIGSSRNKEEFEKNTKSVFGILCEYNESSSLSKQDKLAEDIKSFIEQNFGDPELSLEKLARVFYISQNHVSRVLKSTIGKSYKEYLNDVRINEAKRLLKTTHMTVLSVANSVGYTDMSAFNRLFKKYTNHTPNEYRLMN